VAKAVQAMTREVNTPKRRKCPIEALLYAKRMKMILIERKALPKTEGETYKGSKV